MNILCINTNGLHNDGITNSILNYYSHMNKEDMNIDILQTKDVDPSTRTQFENASLNLVFTEYRNRPIRYLIKTAKLIKQKKYDIVHIHGSSALLSLDLAAAKLGGCRVRIAHSRNTTCNHKVLDKLLRPLFIRLCNVRFACGEDAGRWLFGKRNFRVIKNGKDLEQFSFHPETRAKIRDKYGWTGKIVIGHVGNFNYQKNHEFLIQVFSELHKIKDDYQLVLMGSGTDYQTKAMSLVKKSGLEDRVLFMGSVNNVPELLQAMDLMLLPSRFEGLPNVVLEWQAVGLPAIISDKVTHECEVTDLLTYLPIDQGVDCWVDHIVKMHFPDREKASSHACAALKKNGFDIEKNSEILRTLYMKLSER